MAPIPPPASWKSCRTVQQVPGLSEKEQGELKACLQRLYQEHLDSRKLWQNQAEKAKAALCAEAHEECRFLARYKDEWPVEFILRYTLIASRSRLKTQATRSRKPAKTRVSPVKKRASSSRSTRAAGDRKAQLSRATKVDLIDDDPESEDELVRLSDQISSKNNIQDSKESASHSTAYMIRDLSPISSEDEPMTSEGVPNTSNLVNATATTQGHGDDDVSAQENSELPKENDEAAKPSQAECELMYPEAAEIHVDEDVQMEEVENVLSGTSTPRALSTEEARSELDRLATLNISSHGSAKDPTPVGSPSSTNNHLLIVVPSLGPTPSPFLSTTQPSRSALEPGKADDVGYDALGQALNGSATPEGSPTPTRSTTAHPATAETPSGDPTHPTSTDNTRVSASPAPVRARSSPPAPPARPYIHTFLHGVFPPLASPEVVQRFVGAGIVEPKDLRACARLPERDQLAMLRVDLGLNVLHSRMVRAALARM